MKTRNKIALVAGLGIMVAGLSVYAQLQHTDQAPEGRPPGPPHARLGQVLDGVISQYDANQDGQLDATEIAALRQAAAEGKVAPPRFAADGMRGRGEPPAHLSKELLEKYDLNQDGTLDATERAALRQDVQDGKLPPPALGRGPRPPFGERPSAREILLRFDADKDGRLDETELTAFLDSAPAPGPFGRRGGGAPLGRRPHSEVPPQGE